MDVKTLSTPGVFYFLTFMGVLLKLQNASALTQNKPSTESSVLTPIRQTALPRSAVKEDDYAELISDVHKQVNEFRRHHGLKPLTLNPIISAQAREHSAEMAQSGKTVSHHGFDQRLRAIQKEIPFGAAAENVAASSGYENPARTAVEGWKSSSEHRKNMLGDFSLTGIGVTRNKEGTYFVTQIFLKPLK